MLADVRFKQFNNLLLLAARQRGNLLEDQPGFTCWTVATFGWNRAEKGFDRQIEDGGQFANLGRFKRNVAPFPDRISLLGYLEMFGDLCLRKAFGLSGFTQAATEITWWLLGRSSRLHGDIIRVVLLCY